MDVTKEPTNTLEGPKDALDERRSSLGDDHPDTISALKALATAYLEQDELEEAMPLLRESLEKTKRIHGEEHPDTIKALRNCAIILGQQEKFTEAEPFLRELLIKQTKLLGDTHADTLETMSLLGFVLTKIERFQEANPILKNLLDKQKRVFGEKDQKVLDTMGRYVVSLLNLGRFEEGELVSRDLLQLTKEVHGVDHPSLNRISHNLALALKRQGKFKQEWLILDELLTRQRDALGPDHPDTIETMDRVARCLSSQDRHYEAETLFNEVLEKRRRILGEDHDDIFAAMKSIAVEQLEQGKNPQAALIFRDVWVMKKRFLGNDHVDTISALATLTDILWHSGGREEILSLSRKVFEVRKRTLGDAHPDTISARETFTSRLAELEHSEAATAASSSIASDDVAEQADGEEDVDVAAPSVVRQTGDPNEGSLDGPAMPDDLNSEGEVSPGDGQTGAAKKSISLSPNTDQLCHFCGELNPAFYLGSVRVYGGVHKMSYPSCDQWAGALLLQRGCPLCRLICRGFSEKLRAPLTRLDSFTKISYRYVWPETLTRETDESGAVSDRMVVKADMLLLEVSTKSHGLLWVYAVETGDGCIERVQAVSDVRLSLRSSSRDVSHLDLFKYGLETITSWSSQEARGELRNIMTRLGENSYLKGRAGGELVDTSLLRTWIQHCDSYHGVGCKPIEIEDSRWLPSWVIDVQRRMLIPGSQESVAMHYAALSYVWGGVGVPQLRHTANGGIDGRLKSPGGLADHWEDIPHTIKDAMVVCQEIGIPYLWVDAICLNQDDMTDHHLNSMGKIYQGACVTIVAAAGRDSWAGLPGIRPRLDQTSRITEKVGDISLGLYIGSSQKMIEDAKWNTRAWTFQELILSKRVLIFTEEEVLYECDSGVAWRETVFSEHPDLPSKDFSIPSSNSSVKLRLSSIIESIMKRGERDSVGPSDIYGPYLDILKGYMQRQMTDVSDILKALQGILTEIGEETAQYFFKGILLGYAYQSLLFDVAGCHHNLRRPKFPSWSWCGWQNIEVVDKASTPGIKFVNQFEIAWFRPKIVLYRWESSEVHEQNSSGVHSFVAIDGKDVEVESRYLHIEAADKGEDWAQEVENMLVFSADTLQVTVSSEGEPVRWDPETRRYDVVSPELDLAFIDLNKAWRDKQPVALEFVALAEAKAFDDDDFLKVDAARGHVFPKMGWANHPVSLVAALLVETDAETGISQRLGLYKIAKEYWDRAARATRTVYLC